MGFVGNKNVGNPSQNFDFFFSKIMPSNMGEWGKDA